MRLPFVQPTIWSSPSRAQLVQSYRGLQWTNRSLSLNSTLSRRVPVPSARRVFAAGISTAPDRSSPLFNTTRGRHLFNEERYREARYTPFNVEALKREACQALGAEKCTSFEKVDEDAFNMVFQLQFDNGRLAQVRIPNPMAGPSHDIVASEVATLDYARTCLNIPIPEVYAYSTDPSTDLGAAYMILEAPSGTPLQDWMAAKPELSLVHPLVGSVVGLEEKLTKPIFGAYGSIYYEKDILPGVQYHPLYQSNPPFREGGDRFVIGPSVDRALWKGANYSLDVERGPWLTPQDALSAYANAEKAWIQAYAKPRPALDYFQPDLPPEEHVSLLDQYVAALNSGIVGAAESPAWQPILRRPDISSSNVYVREDPTQPLSITSVLGWQHTCILPACIADRPSSAPLYNPVYATIPSQDEGPAPAVIPPGTLEKLSAEEKQEALRDLILANMAVSYLHATKSRHTRATIDDTPWLDVLRRLHEFAPDCWSHQFLQFRGYLSLLQIGWPDASIPCPVKYDKNEAEYNLFVGAKAHQDFDELRSQLLDQLGADAEGLVSHEEYETAKAGSIELEREWDTQWGQYPLQDGRWSPWLR